MTEKEYVINSFKKNLKKLKDKKVVIYGIGKSTKVVLDEFTDFNFIGLMDPVKEGDIVFGKPVLSVSDISNMDVDAIIIIARSSNLSIIYQRIENICKSKNIDVYDINGSLIENIISENQLESDYFNKSIDDIKNVYQNYECISFDVFDTLIMRKTLYPVDVFQIVDKKAKENNIYFGDFYSLRTEAERELNLEKSPKIIDIYNRCQEKEHFSDEIKEKLMKLEIETEREVLIPRTEMVDLLKWLVSKDVDVYLISDMYLNKEILEPILNNFGIQGYKKLMVSCDYGKSKCNGLYNYYLDLTKKEKYLHIGDNYEADGNMAKLNGLDTYSIKSSIDMMDLSNLRILKKYDNDFRSRCIIGNFISNVLNNPFVFYKTEGKISIDNNYDFGYSLIGPFIFTFIEWMLGQVKKEKIDTLLLSARDGFIINKILKSKKLDLDNNLNIIYFKTSRMSSAIAAIKNEEDIKYLSSLAFSGSAEEMLQTRFFLDLNDIKAKEYGESDEKYILRHRDLILDKVKEARKNYLKYIDALKLKDDTNIGFFDFVSSGTCQMNLEKIMNKNLKGLYFLKVLEDYEGKLNLNVSTLLESKFVYEKQSCMFDSYIFLENIMTSYEPSIKSFDEDGLPEYLYESRSDYQIEKIKEVHKGIFDFYFDMDIVLSGKVSNNEILLVDEILKNIKNGYSLISASIFKDTTLKDDFCSREFDSAACLAL
ncbi:hypothetical protein VN21_10485 [Paraclostridium benzoelyticum]|uniref:Hydrolase n=1 Tax=Paraclostridium benzoelyticum TaxID=1629550 RepID=A0A0M3DEN1_9FIRM|nr:hypothetical protein [Paraclostridium benzoelyticum]KKY01090.1 hypothetical protein VN21_10485 [Paraclostridium benzoelyticum]